MTLRLPTFDPADWAEAVREILGDARTDIARDDASTTQRRRKGPPNILFTIARLPHLLAPFLGFSSGLATRGVLERRDSELLALRASWHCRSAFEWGHHVEYARDAGLDDDEIDRIRIGPDAPGWSDDDRALLRAADELHTRQCISDQTWTTLTGSFTEAQLVEIPFIVGQYTMLSMVANSTGVPLEPGLPPMPDPGGPEA